MAARLVSIVLGAAVAAAVAMAADPPSGYVGKAVCAVCHEEAAAALAVTATVGRSGRTGTVPPGARPVTVREPLTPRAAIPTRSRS
jgi:hypothetical protein